MRRRVTDALGKKISGSPVGDLTTDQVRKAMDKIKESGLKSATVNMDLRALRRALHAAVTAGLAKANVAARESVRVMKEKGQHGPRSVHCDRSPLHDRSQENQRRMERMHPDRRALRLAVG
jgi:site-specific recombinase XerC